MDDRRIDRRVHGPSALGILVGLVLVTLELNQNARLVRAELGSGSMSHRQTLLTSLQGEVLAEALATAPDAPEASTRTEEVVLHAWHQNVVGQVLRQSYLIGLGVFEDPIEPFASARVRACFGSAWRRAWWREHRADYPEHVRALLDGPIAALPAQRSARALDRISAAAVAGRRETRRRDAP